MQLQALPFTTSNLITKLKKQEIYFWGKREDEFQVDDFARVSQKQSLQVMQRKKKKLVTKRERVKVTRWTQNWRKKKLALGGVEDTPQIKLWLSGKREY